MAVKKGRPWEHLSTLFLIHKNGVVGLQENKVKSPNFSPCSRPLPHPLTLYMTIFFLMEVAKVCQEEAGGFPGSNQKEHFITEGNYCEELSEKHFQYNRNMVSKRKLTHEEMSMCTFLLLQEGK